MRIIKTEEIWPETSLSPDDRYWVYNGMDCLLTEEIMRSFESQLDEVARNTYNFSLALQGPILEMNARGVLVNQNTRARIMKKFREQLTQLESQLNRIISEGIGTDLNWRSPKQLGNLLYDVMGLPEQKKRNTNGIYARSVDREALEKLENFFIAEPIIRHMLLMRDLGKALGFLETGIDGDGRMRTSFNIAGTNTGRLASSESAYETGTNLQNVARDLRQVFVADPGWKFANLDLEQADSRNLGALCWNIFVQEHGEAVAGAYLDACESGDLHTAVCKLCNPQFPWGTKPDREIADTIFYRDKTYRDGSKVLGHGCLTADHEVLTPQGWVPITAKPDVIMTWSARESKFDVVSHWVDKQYTGEFYRFSGPTIEATMTEDHRVPWRLYKTASEHKVRLASEGVFHSIPSGGKFRGGNTHMPYARLNAMAHFFGENLEDRTIFSFTNYEDVARLASHCQDYHIAFRRKDKTCWVMGKLKIDIDWSILSWDEYSHHQFFDEYSYYRGDNIDLMDTYLHLVGYRDDILGKSISHTSWTGTEQVYCPTVPSTFFYIRKDGHVSVTGNSNYLGKPVTMAKHTKFPKHLVETFQKTYFASFPIIPEYHKHVRHQVRNFSSLTTLFGRRRFFFGRADDDATIREAVAYSPQSMTADEIDIGLLALWRSNRVQLLIQVHDSILFQYREEEEDEIIPWALETLKAPLTLTKDRPFVVPTEAKVGWNWGDCVFWSKSDYETGKCSLDMIGTVKSNPDGLIKWKGADSRKRVDKDTKLSLHGW